jgi:hypothetical protein
MYEKSYKVEEMTDYLWLTNYIYHAMDWEVI